MRLALLTRTSLLILSAFPLLAIDGTVHNATTDKPQPAATVSLFQITQSGPQMLTSVKSSADGTFTLQPPAGDTTPGPKLLQAVYNGVTYNRMIPPGTPTENLQIEVYDSSSKPGAAHVTTHMLLLEPVNGSLTVSESYVYTNDSKITYNNPDAGTLRFYVPPAANGKMELNVLAPNSVAVRRAADPTGTPGVYKLDFPVKPGESRVDVTYQIPFTAPAAFESKVFFPRPNTKLLAPSGVTLTGAGLSNLGPEPRTQATIYNFDGPDLRVNVQGSGALSRADNTAQAGEGDQGGDQGSAIAELLPQLYGKASPADGIQAAVGGVKWILLLIFAVLALTFTYLYRRHQPSLSAGGSSTGDASAAPPSAKSASSKPAHERRG